MLQIDTKTSGNWNTYIPSESASLENEYTVYPNPAKTQLFITGSFTEVDYMNIEIFDISGRLLLQKTTSGNSGIFEIRLDDLAVGTYTYRIIKNNEVVKSDKLIIIQ